tara:strand:- start:4020 stop:5816 length:1797 start_codon:yes stop_codon:yes gene_type:complete
MGQTNLDIEFSVLTLQITTNGGTKDWINPTFAQTFDGALTTTTLQTSEVSKILVYSGPQIDLPSYGSDYIPVGAVVTGFELRIYKKEELDPVANIIDDTISLILNQVPVGDNKATAVKWVDGYVTYGGIADMWGTSLTRADVVDPSFGVGWAATNNGFVTGEGKVDDIQFILYWVHTMSEVGSGGAKLGGISSISDETRIPEGGILVAPRFLTPDRYPTGGAVLAGTVITSDALVGGGGLLLSGVSDLGLTYTLAMSGGAVLSGVAALDISGGVTLSGTAIISGPFTEAGSGGVLVAPNAPKSSTFIPSGGMVVPSTTVFVGFIKSFTVFPVDTVCFLSGGLSNNDPLLSIGGTASLTEVESNLFDNFQPSESTTGLEDYRCIYIYNALTNSIEDIKLWIEIPPTSDTVTTIGIDESDDMQEVKVDFFAGFPSTGSFTLDFDGNDIVVSASSDLESFALNFQNALRDNTSLTDVTVAGQLIGATITFIVHFVGDDGKRDQPTFALKNNSLEGNPSMTINKVIVGSPINATAETIATDTTIPLNPSFKSTTEALPIVVPSLNVNEGFPLWIKRTVAINPIPTQNDGFTLRVFVGSVTIV